ncbi:D-alanyl-D-alanine carboxypeptidase family protein [Streptomyces sp. NPDC058674]|uniref:D-alanyl-D-alanine carboxypeptidase family protein n=1 Tax=Streptomyces sp. NPDC058674 TaxID=3346592 RepID=UPI00364F476F
MKPPVAPAGKTGADRAAPPKASTFVPLRTEGAPAPAAAPRPKPAPAAAPAPQPKPAAAAPAAVSAPSVDSPERTTQQPLPPKPPLDMLADLTNNPPPPPSPLRTAVRRVKIYAPLVVLLAIVLGIVQLVRPLPEPALVMTAKSSYTFDGSKPDLPWPGEGQAYMAAAGLGTLGQSGEQKPVPIASVTKSMTAYIILRDHPVKKGEKGEMIDVDKTAETEGKKNNSTDNESTLDTVKEGDKLSEYDAIAALMIPSANNIARLLARWDAGSQEAFVKKMNDTAKELGMKNTTYTDPSGLDATTVSTAEDQVKLGLKLVEIETLLEITKKPSWEDPSGKVWRNWNGLVPYNDSLGIKTGTTTKAGGNLLFAAQKKVGSTNQLIVGAVLGQHKPPIIDSVLAASKQLMTATQKSLVGSPVVKKGDVVGYVDDGLGGRTPVVATADVQAVGWASLTVAIKLSQADGSKIPQTAKAGTEIGVLTVGEGASQVKVPVALQSDLVSPGIGSKLTRVG